MSRPTYRSPTETRRRRVVAPLEEEGAFHSYIRASAQVEEAHVAGAAISTRIPSLDIALGGGYPRGVVELWGTESVGKTALLGHAMVSAQEAGRDVALICTEYLDIPYFEAIGVDVSRLFVVRPFEDNLMGSDLEDFALGFAQVSGNVLVIDSLTATRKLLQEDVEWNAAALALVEALAHESDPASLTLVSSQVRTKYYQGRPTSRVRSASSRLVDLFSASLELARTDVREKEYTLCIDVKANVLDRPGRYIEVPASKGTGVKVENDLLDRMTEMGVLTRAGNYWHAEGASLGPGYKRAAVQLHELQLFEPLYAHLLSFMTP